MPWVSPNSFTVACERLPEADGRPSLLRIGKRPWWRFRQQQSVYMKKYTKSSGPSEAAAERCEQAGFHGVELHAHGYLIAQFLGRGTNRRKDGWGGDQANRTRFLGAIVDEVRRRTGPTFLVGVRLSPQLTACGLTIEDSLKTLRLCNAMPLDFVHVSCWDIAETTTIDGRDVPFTTVFRTHLNDEIPLFTTGSVWNASDAIEAVQQGAEFVGVGRAGIAHPNWPVYLENAQDEPKRPAFSVSELEAASLNPTFIEYMRR